MIETKVAKRYAKSVIDLSGEMGIIDAVNSDMKLFASVCSENHDLGLLFSNPIIHKDKKLVILQKIFSGQMNKLTMTFFALVIHKGREKYLIQIANEFINQYKELRKVLTAEIVSAVGLDDKLRNQVYSLLRNEINSEVELVEKIDKKLIGGFVLRIGDKQYDASISSSLRKLTQSFSGNDFVNKN